MHVQCRHAHARRPQRRRCAADRTSACTHTGDADRPEGPTFLGAECGGVLKPGQTDSFAQFMNSEKKKSRFEDLQLDESCRLPESLSEVSGRS